MWQDQAVEARSKFSPVRGYGLSDGCFFLNQATTLPWSAVTAVSLYPASSTPLITFLFIWFLVLSMLRMSSSMTPIVYMGSTFHLNSLSTFEIRTASFLFSVP